MNEKLHRNCEKHTAENCDINTHGNLEPVTDDCGHYVPEGPGTKEIEDTNMYNVDHGKKSVLLGWAREHMDQDVSDGPGAKTE